MNTMQKIQNICMNSFHLGNEELLNWWKIGFLASRKISSSAILSTLDWAVEISKRADVVVVSGFHSRLEKDVLKFLLQGKCGIIIVLARGMYRKLPKIYDVAMKENRLLIVSLEKKPSYVFRNAPLTNGINMSKNWLTS